MYLVPSVVFLREIPEEAPQRMLRKDVVVSSASKEGSLADCLLSNWSPQLLSRFSPYLNLVRKAIEITGDSKAKLVFL